MGRTTQGVCCLQEDELEEPLLEELKALRRKIFSWAGEPPAGCRWLLLRAGCCWHWHGLVAPSDHNTCTWAGGLAAAHGCRWCPYVTPQTGRRWSP